VSRSRDSRRGRPRIRSARRKHPLRCPRPRGASGDGGRAVSRHGRLAWWSPLLCAVLLGQKALPPTLTAPPSASAAPGVVFSDVTAASGLDRFHHVSGGPAKDYIVEATGSGVALVDYDDDGWLDVYLVNG